MNLNDILHASAESMIVGQLGGHIIENPDNVGGTDIGSYAVEYATRGWPVFPLKYDKTPATRHGVLDATTNLGQIVSWWQGTHRGASIGLRVPDDLIVIDVDPRNGGEPNWRKLNQKFGTMPETMMVYSGRGDGGRHYYMRKPPNTPADQRITTKGLKRELGVQALGVDVKTNAGYVVAPPSPHPATGNPYRAENFGMFAEVPPWLWFRLTNDEPPKPKAVGVAHEYDDSSPADWFSAHTTWNQILEPHGWQVVGHDGDAEGSCWKHPAATSPLSATIRHGNLFVYSPNTPFDMTEPGDAHGYTRFRAFAVLNYGGDLTTAAIAVAMARVKTGL